MVENRSDMVRVIQGLTGESANYLRQFNLWIGLGSAGATVALLSFSANLPDPDFALRRLLPSFVAFLFGVIASGVSLLFVSKREEAAALHYTNSHNRDEFAKAIANTPEVISSPTILAEKLNLPRNKLIEKNQAAHEESELAWKWRRIWNAAYWACIFVSVASFLCGVSWPVLYVISGGEFVR